MFSSLKAKMITYVLIIIALLSLLFCGAAYWKMKSSLLESINSEIEQAAAGKVSFLTEWVSSRQLIVASTLGRFSNGDLKPVLDQAKVAGGFDDMYIGQPDKKMTQFSNATPVPPGYDPTVRPWYVAAAASQEAIASPPYIDASTKLPIITFAKALRENGNLVAVAGGDVTLKRVVDEVIAAKLPGDGYAFLITQDGQVIAHPQKDSGLKKIAEVLPGFDLAALPKDGTISQLQLGDENTLTALFPVGTTGWILGVVVPEAKAMAPINRLLYTMLTLMGVGLLIAFFATSFGITRMMSSITLLRDAMHTMSLGGGDLTVNLSVDSKDEVGQTKDSFNRFLGTLRSMVSEVKENSGSLLSGIEKVGQETDRISEGSKQQATFASETAAAVEEMTASISQIAESARNAEKMTQESGRVSQQLVGDVRQTSEEIGLISSTVEQLQTTLKGLDARSLQINNIVAVIKEIADQTNLLALNAAIEAARAGEQGRGFAVVADEVRKLAERTGVSTVEIGNMIQLIQDETKSAVTNMESAVQQVNRGVEKSRAVTESIEHIERSAQEVERALSAIASATTEQSSASHEIARNIERIHEMTETSDLSIQETHSETENLRQLAHELRVLMEKFRV
ncbi:methyl-accepting chemotaxis protein [Rhodocyclus tenuis]|uniref:Methyl-accepting chemotaxis protein n=1 Tax=Rhodocyclus gracilis TaxID=2929842 RepID=A0ABX0WD40_9RHOO|nr:methyl-accepting chemotaxis protein [Rhodocyclus gracilis]NJA87659.1 methyl-accepting chemotaxis protein [Rhodocyclus gracilis]